MNKTEPAQHKTKLELLNLLSKIENAGAFASSGRLTEPCMLDLEVDSVGRIGFPLAPSQAKELISVCTLAPFGRKEETVYDTSVRNTWQINADKVHIKNPKWKTQLNSILTKVSDALGVRTTVEARLYKLLLYETGSFFKPHRDTEKEDKMFATLVIQLPCQYEGGELVVKHNNTKRTINCTQDSSSNTYYAAFYADCDHEVLPVKSGYRICLVYNLVQTGPGELPRPLTSDALSGIISFMQRWSNEKDPPHKLLIPLEHQYSAAGLLFTGLKSRDRSIAEILKQVRLQVPLEMYLCQVKYTETGCPETDYYNRSTQMDVYETEITLSNWTKLDGTKEPLLQDISFEKEEWVSDTLINEAAPDHQEINEATGNEGASMERWYTSAALVIWPKSHECDVWVRQSDPRLLTQKLTQLLETATKDSPEWQLCQRLAQKLSLSNIYLLSPPLEALIKFGDVQLCKTILRSHRFYSGFSEDEDVMKKLFNTFGTKPFIDELVKITSSVMLPTAINMLLSVTSMVKEQPSALEDCLEFGKSIVNKLSEKDLYFTAEVETLTNLFKALYAIGDASLIESAFSIIMSPYMTRSFPIVTCVLPAIQTIYKWLGNEAPNCDPFLRICSLAILPLQEIIESCVFPTSWTITASASHSCLDCVALNKFLADPVRVGFLVHGATKAEHINDQTKGMTDIKSALFFDHITLTKTRDSYVEKEKQKQIAITTLNWIGTFLKAPARIPEQGQETKSGCSIVKQQEVANINYQGNVWSLWWK